MARLLAAGCSLGLLLCVLGANWAISRFGVVAVGFGLYAPAGVVFAGLAFTFRDGVHEWGGRRWALAAVVAGAALSACISGRLALASGASFALSELADMEVYQPLRRRSRLLGIFASNVVGGAIDSALFLGLAFGSMDLLAGLVMGKLWPTLALVGAVAAYRRRARS